MTVAELLEELREGILHDVSQQISGASDKLWPDDRLVRYIDQAQQRFARESECLRDAVTPECSLLTTTVGERYFPMHPKVFGVLSARYMGVPVNGVYSNPDQADLARSGHSNLDTYPAPTSQFFNPTFLSELQPGKTLAYTTDEGLMSNDKGSMEAMTFRTYPEVGSGYAGVIKLRVVRLPLNKLTTKNLNATPEIPETYHLDMLDWAAYLACRTIDVDMAGADQIFRIRDFKAAFADTVTKVKNNLRKKEFAPLTWAFGRNGFTYEPSYY